MVYETYFSEQLRVASERDQSRELRLSVLCTLDKLDIKDQREHYSFRDIDKVMSLITPGDKML